MFFVIFGRLIEGLEPHVCDLLVLLIDEVLHSVVEFKVFLNNLLMVVKHSLVQEVILRPYVVQLQLFTAFSVTL